MFELKWPQNFQGSFDDKLSFNVETTFRNFFKNLNSNAKEIHINSHPYVFGRMKWGGGDVAFGYSDNRTSNCYWPDCLDLVVSGFPQHPLKLM